jgi:prevent-host-death family protein
MAVRSIPVDELHRQLNATLANVAATGEPVAITASGEPKVMLVRFQEYDALLRRIEEGHPGVIRRPDISGGEPILAGSRISIRHIVERTRAGMSPEDIVSALPHLTLGQVYEALAYYFDHREEIDALLSTSDPSVVLDKLGLAAIDVGDGISVIRSK